MNKIAIVTIMLCLSATAAAKQCAPGLKVVYNPDGSNLVSPVPCASTSPGPGASRVGVQDVGARGKVLNPGGVARANRVAHSIYFFAGVSGWVHDDHLRAFPQPTPQPTSTPGSSPTPTPSPSPSATPQPSGNCVWFVAPANATRVARKPPGSIDNPWLLSTVFTDHGVPGSIKPGAVICLREGVYLGSYHVQLLGTPTAQITVQPYPGERATVDGEGISVDGGGYVTIRDLEVTNSDPSRTDYRAGGFAVTARGVKVINCNIHDTGAAFTSNETGFDDEFYGNVIYNIGWDDRNSGLHQGGTGPAFYVSNEHGFKKFHENVVSNDFGVGWHLYSAGGGHLTNFDLQGNVTVNSGYWTRVRDSSYAPEGRTAENLVVGNRPITNLTFKNNFGFHRENRGGMNLNLGYGVQESKDAIVQDNTMIGGTNSVARFASLDFERNLLVSSWEELYYTPPAASDSQIIDNNTYFWYRVGCAPTGQFNAPGETPITVAQWKALGFDQHSTINPCGKRPSGLKMWIRPNRYDANRAHVIVYNPDKTATVSLDLGAFLKAGDKFELHDAQNIYGPLPASGVYQGPVAVNMARLTVAVPVGYNAATMTPLSLMTSGPEFGAFVLIKK